MRKINPKGFTVAKQGISRKINRQIALTLIKTNQPLSRADLSRLMNTSRANITFLINDLMKDGLVREGSIENNLKPGRPPIFLHLDSKENFVIAVDIRATRTFILTTNMLGSQLGKLTSFPTELEPLKLAVVVSGKIEKLIKQNGGSTNCAGVGIVIPGMVNSASGIVLNAPTLGWSDVDFYSMLKKYYQEIPIFIENSGRACALSRLWISRKTSSIPDSLVFISISDGVGVGVIVNGELLSGKHNTAGEFGHLSLDINGPQCSCGAKGCWEAYISNLATISRYTENYLPKNKYRYSELPNLTIEDLIKLARNGNQKAITAIQLTGKFIGLGLAAIINTIDPEVIYIAGEITEAWDLLKTHLLTSLKQRVLTKESKKTPVLVVPADEYPRLKGGVALVTAPAFAAPKIA